LVSLLVRRDGATTSTIGEAPDYLSGVKRWRSGYPASGRKLCHLQRFGSIADARS
jgi:hypothetical protein